MIITMEIAMRKTRKGGELCLLNIHYVPGPVLSILHSYIILVTWPGLLSSHFTDGETEVHRGKITGLVSELEFEPALIPTK